MLNLERTGLCAGCPACAPHIKSFYMQDTAEFTVVCKNATLCKYIWKHLAASIGEGKTEGDIDGSS